MTHKDSQTAYKLAAWSSIILLLYSLATILIVFLIGGPPESAEEVFEMIAKNRYSAYLRLDVLTVFVMPFYFVLFYGIYLSLKAVHHTLSLLSAAFVFVGVTLFLASPSVFTYVQLSDAYHAAETADEKAQFLAACKAVVASDIWHGTGTRLGGLLVQMSATIFSLLMLKSNSYNKFTAYTGLITHSSDLLHIIIGFSSTLIANSIMAVSGIFYLLWFPLMAIALFRMNGKNDPTFESKT